MSIIYSYPEETSLLGSDMLIGTSTTLIGGKQKNITKNFTLDELSAFMSGGSGIIDPVASDFQIAVFNQAGKKLTGSIMSQNVFPNGTGITISGNLTVPGTVTLGGGTNLITLASTTKLGGAIQDFSGATGALNQILIANASGGLSWSNFTSGLTYLGLWDANNNNPGLTSSVGANSTFYIVNAAGTTPLNGNTDWEVGDWAIFVGTTGAGGIWQKIDNTSSITGNGTRNKIPLWSSTFQLTDSLMSQDAGATTLTIAGALTSTGNIIGSDISGVNITGTGNLSGTDLLLTGKISLSTDYGTPGQVLTSGGSTGNSVWATPTTGTVTGTGTTNRLPIWSDGGAKTLGDSILDQVAAGGEFTDTYLSILGTGGLSTQGLEINKFLLDGAGLKGASGQILSSTGTEVRWVTDSGGGVTYTLDAGAQDAASVPLNLTDSANVTTPVKLTGGTDIDVIRTSGTEITINNTATDTNTTYDFGSSTDGADVLLNLVGTPTDNSSVKLIGSGVTIAQAADQVTFTVPAGDTYDLNAGTKSGTSVPLNLTSGSSTDNSVVNLTEGTGITLTRDSATEITISGSAQGITGSGTVNKLPKFDTTTSLTDSIVTQSGGITTITPLINNVISFSPQTSQFTMPSYATNNTVTGPTPQVGDILDFVLTSDLTFPFAVIPAGTYPYTITFAGSGLSCSFNSYTIPASAGGFGYTNMLGNGSSSGTNTVNTLSIDGPLSMLTNKIINVAQPTAAQDAATKQYVDDVVTGQLVFQGGYDAVNNSPDLTTSPNSILKGWTYAVTNGPSTSFWSPPLNVGDLVIANIDNPTSVADWTEVQSNVGFAGSGATDGATVKGIAGFNSADFDVSNDGWVEAKDFSGSTPGYVPDATGAGTGTFLSKTGSWAIPPDSGGTVTSVGLTMPAAFSVTNSPITSSGNLAVTPTGGIAGQFLDYTGNWSSPGGGVSSVSQGTPFSSTGLPLLISPTSGAVVISSAVYNGGSNIGIVPDGGTSAEFLKGDGSWASVPAGYTSWTASSDQNTNITVTDTTNLPFTGRLASDGAYASIPNESGIYTDTAINTGEVTIGLINNGGTPSASTFYRGDGQWVTPSGAGATIATANFINANSSILTFGPLGATPSSKSFVDVFIDGVYQEEATYDITNSSAGNTGTLNYITFTVATGPPPTGVTIETRTVAEYNLGAAVSTINTTLIGDVVLNDPATPIIGPTAATKMRLYIFADTAAAHTLTLPALPLPGDSVKISNISTRVDNVIATGNSELIMAQAAPMTLDTAAASFEMIYTNATQGWVIIGAGS